MEYVRHIINREKAGLSLGGSGLKYTVWNVERSSLSTDKEKNTKWSMMQAHTASYFS